MKKIALVVFVITAVLISCGKEGSFENDNTPNLNPTKNDSTLLTRIISLDTTKASPLDTVYKFLVTYDSLKRPNTISYVEYYPLLSNFDTSVNLKYDYLGKDTLPSKLIGYIDRRLLKVEHHYKYDNTAKRNIIVDSAIYQDNTPGAPIYSEVYKYSYFPNLVSTNLIYRLNGNIDSQYTFKSYLQLQNSNIINQTDTMGIAYKYVNTFNVIYDAKPNPLKYFTKTVPYFGNNSFDAYLGVPGYNNITEFKYTTNSSGSNQTVYYKKNYKYNSLNYPTEATIKDLGSTNTYYDVINKQRYFYLK